MKNSHPLFQVRELQVRDIEGVCRLATELIGPAFQWPKEKLRGQLQDSNTRSFIAEVPGDKASSSKILAFVCLMELGPAVEIPVLATAKEAQHSGVMKDLLGQVFATHYGARELWLEVHESNQSARNLYRTLGFVESGRRPDYYQDGSAAILCNRFPQKMDSKLS